MIEFLIYIALTVVILTVITDFSVDVIRHSARAGAAKTVQQSSRYLLSRMVEELKAAEQIISVVPDRIELINSDGVAVAFFIDNTEEAVYYSSGGTDTKLSDPEIAITRLDFFDDNGLVFFGFDAESKKKDHSANSLYSMNMETKVKPRRLLY